MNLEDHAGDIVRKARAMCNLDATRAAAAADLDEGQYADLEETGACSARPNFAALGSLLGLDARKLQEIFDGWGPAQKDLSVWGGLRMLTQTAHGMAVNCYLVWDPATRAAALFDTGWEAQPVLDMVNAQALKLADLFITHSHEDHVAALPELRRRHPRLRVHSNARNAPAEERMRPGDCTPLGALRITSRETPGHASDGTTYIVGSWPGDAPQVAIVGDAIFAGSIGRGNQSWDLARRTVRDQILSLPASTLICPGHGPLTTVQEETDHNPFF